jgi:hypothetical protein
MKFTTREHLEEDVYGCLNGAVLDYGEHVITVLEHGFEGIKVEIYEMIETPEETGLERCECRLSKIADNKGFKDTGHAVAWALAELK